MGEDVERLLGEQIRYYEDRAPEYEDLWHRVGRYDRGPEFAAGWFRETAAVEAAVDALDATGSVLEIACGSGLWTRRLAPQGTGRYVGVDASPAMLALNRERTSDPRIQYVEADVFTWSPHDGERFDLIFMGFFVSHVPPELFAGFWERLRAWLSQGGRVFLCDDRDGSGRPYSGDAVVGEPAYTDRRRLAAGQEYTIVKLFYSPQELADKLDALGWDAEFRSSGEQFLFGTATPR